MEIVSETSSEEAIAVYALEMNINETMATLKTLASRALSQDLTLYSVTILSEKQLLDSQSLKEHCGQHIGPVQVQFTLKASEQLIDIVDVVKPDDDPYNWKMLDVWHWLTWAETQFGLQNIEKKSWRMTGKTLMNLTYEEFRNRVPYDPGDIFFMHFALLKKTKVVAVMCDPSSSENLPVPPKGFANFQDKTSSQAKGDEEYVISGNGQQIQLWQYILELLTDPKMTSVISWCGDDGEFKIYNPDAIAQLWGLRKGRPAMSYDKLSRSLRYYYSWNMMTKVSGQKFVYKFNLDLKKVLGYNAQELREQIESCKNLSE